MGEPRVGGQGPDLREESQQGSALLGGGVPRIHPPLRPTQRTGCADDHSFPARCEHFQGTMSELAAFIISIVGGVAS